MKRLAGGMSCEVLWALVLMGFHLTVVEAEISRFISGEIGGRVLLLGDFSFTNGGTLRFDFDITMQFARENRSTNRMVVMNDQQWESLGTRTLLHLVVCTPAEVAFLASYKNRLVPSNLPAYCALSDGTIGDRCLSIPLTYGVFNASSGDYSVRQTVFRTFEPNDSALNIAIDTNVTSNDFMFYLDACELVGGDFGVLRSCLGENGSLAAAITDSLQPANTMPCFHCSMLDQQHGPVVQLNVDHGQDPSNCVDPPYLDNVPITIQYRAQLCNGNGFCLDDTQDPTAYLLENRRLALRIFYAFLSLGWGCFCAVWFLQLRRSQRRHIRIIDLQKRMRLIPLAQFVYSVLVLLELFVSVRLISICIYASKFFGLALAAEVLLLIAKGWQITRPMLHAKDFHWIQSISIIWSFCFVILEYNLADRDVFLAAWVLTWCCIVFSISYYSSYNMNMLEFQLRLVRHIGIDPTTTPVYTKFTLFSRYRTILATYLIMSCVVSLANFVSFRKTQDTIGIVVMMDETLKFVLYIALGHTFRCREFHHLFQPIAAPGQILGTLPPPLGATITPAGVGANGQLPSTVTVNVTTPVSSHNASKKKTSVVFVVNPNHEGALGTSFEPATVPINTLKHVSSTTSKSNRG